jgi:hypothetical protein
MSNKPRVWGVNKYGHVIKEHDKLQCGSDRDIWFTHVIYDTDSKRWNREFDYFYGKVVGNYKISYLMSII